MCRVFLLVIFIPILCWADDKSVTSANDNERKINLDCGGIFGAEQFILESPNYPSNYPSNSDCFYLLQGPDCPSYFTFRFLDFYVEKSLGCSKDRLSIVDQDALCGTPSGVKQYLTNNGVLQVRFISDSDVSARGFRILVTRSECIKPEEASTTTFKSVIKYNETTPNQKCCADYYNQKHFFLTSPGFPYSNSQPTDCSYHIYRANDKICRLRLHFLFFWSGIYNANGCNHGFLEIDGKIICGCRLGLKLISAFDSRWGNNPKIFRFKNLGLPKSVFSGFALEVIQDECPRKLSPEKNQYQASSKNVYYYNDQINRVAWPNITQKDSLDRAYVISQNTEILDDSQVSQDESWDHPQVLKHVYFFKAPDEDDAASDVEFTYTNSPKDIEETTYIDTQNPSLLPNGHDNYGCRAWGVLQWTLLAKQMLWQNMPKCSPTSPTSTPQKCYEFNFQQGYFQSPGYPFYYPGNLNVCYRFYKQPGFCFINFYIQDFQIQESFECTQSYLLLGGKYRYCGSTLYNRKFTIDVSSKRYEEIVLKTDSSYCGRGFKGVYELVECSDGTYPERPTTPPSPATGCNREIREEAFTIELTTSNLDACTFDVIGLQDVCQLQLTFTRFDLSCANEYLLVGGRTYCGSLSGQTVLVDIEPEVNTPITVKRNGGNVPYFRIDGKQKLCEVIEVPAQRQVIIKSAVKPPATKSTNYTEKPRTKVKNVKIILEKQYKDICGVIMNVSKVSHPEKICEKLTDGRENVDCIPISPSTIYVPYGSDRVELKLKQVDMVNEVTFQEVSCEEKDKMKTNSTLNKNA